MTTISDDHLDTVATILWNDVYERSFKGKTRGHFVLTRHQLKRIIDTRRLDGRTVSRLQSQALEKGMLIVDLDDIFACLAVGAVDRWRRVPNAVLEACFGEESPDDGEDEDTVGGDDEVDED